jgi:LacI family transcriptional regulator
MATTLADIAIALGVSKMTVSRAINNHPAINAETRDRVLAVAQRMQYRPNQHARALSTNRSCLIGLVVPDLMLSYYVEIAKAIEAVVRPAGYEILICNTEEDSDRELIEVEALRHRTDGLILASTIAPNKANVYRKMIKEGARIVLLDRRFQRISCPTVETDNLKVGWLATEHLIKQGHTRIGHLYGSDANVAAERFEGYKQALAKYKIRYDEKLVRRCGFLESDGARVMSQWLTEGRLPTAIFAANDSTAIGAMSALFAAGYQVPQDVAFVGTGKIHYGDILRVPLTTVGWDLAEMGQQAARMLIALMNGNTPQPRSTRPHTVAPQLFVRQSCGGTGLNQLNQVAPKVRKSQTPRINKTAQA